MAPSFMRSLTLLAVAALSFSSPLSTPPYVPHRNSVHGINLAPLHEPVTQPHNLINNSYIVMFKHDVHPSVFESHFSALDFAHKSNPLQGLESGLKHVWNDVIKGYAGHFTSEVVDFIRSLPEVDYVERDQIVYALDDGSELETQKSAPWGLARISHRPKLSFSTFQKYVYDKNGGEGVNVYVVDTGVYINHTEFEGRAHWGKTIPLNDEDVDGNGHGTHCAGTIASHKFGVAKSAHIIAVKVLGSNGSGTMSDVVGGVAWAAKDALDTKLAAEAEFRKTGKTKHKGSVANMSLGGGKSRALDDAVNRAVVTGLHFAVAAGNDNRDACDYSPAGAEEAVTVGASTISDERAYFSNHGNCVDIFAPGLNILSTWNSGPHSVNTISGTSMASPHTAGLLAYLLSIYPAATFDPSVADSLLPPALDISTSSPIACAMNVYSFAYEYVPSWMVRFVPAPSFFGKRAHEAPVPDLPTTLTPKQLKKALIKLGTRDVLDIASLPEGSPNVLAFNNATSPDGTAWLDADFWSSL